MLVYIAQVCVTLDVGTVLLYFEDEMEEGERDGRGRAEKDGTRSSAVVETAESGGPSIRCIGIFDEAEEEEGINDGAQ